MSTDPGGCDDRAREALRKRRAADVERLALMKQNTPEVYGPREWPKDKPAKVPLKYRLIARLFVRWAERNNMSTTSIIGWLKIASAVIGVVIAILTGHYAEIAAGLVTVQAGLTGIGLLKAQDARPGTDGSATK